MKHRLALSIASDSRWKGEFQTALPLWNAAGAGSLPNRRCLSRVCRPRCLRRVRLGSRIGRQSTTGSRRDDHHFQTNDNPKRIFALLIGRHKQRRDQHILILPLPGRYIKRLQLRLQFEEEQIDLLHISLGLRRAVRKAATHDDFRGALICMIGDRGTTLDRKLGYL